MWAIDSPLRPIAADLAASIPLIARLRARAGQRRVLKYEHDDRFAARRVQGLDLILLAVKRVLAWAALSPVEIPLPVNSLGRSSSYHAEVDAPSGTAVVRAGLWVTDDGVHTRIAADEVGIDRVHLRVARPPSETPGLPASLSARSSWKGLEGQIRVSIQIPPEGIRPVTIIASIVALISWAGITLHAADVHTRGEAETAAVVALTAVFAFFLGTVPQHRLLNRMGRGVRDAVWVLVAAAFAAGAILALQVPTDWKWAVWFTVGVLSTGTLLNTIAARILGRARITRRIPR